MKIISPVKLNKDTILVDWRYKTITDLVNEVRPQVKGKTLGGYSIGGTIALILAQELNLTKLVLYSPSPLFKEKIKTLPMSELKYLGKKRLADIQNYSTRKLNIKVKADIYVGEDETKDMIAFAKYLDRRLNSSLIVKPRCHHGNIIT